MRLLELHPMLVHFPIALVFVILLFDIGAVVRQESWLSKASLFTLDVAALSAVVTAVTGVIAAINGGVPLSSLLAAEGAGGLTSAVGDHMEAGIVAAVLLIALAAWRHWQPRANPRWHTYVSWAGMVMILLLIVVTGQSGGALVYQWGFGR